MLRLIHSKCLANAITVELGLGARLRPAVAGLRSKAKAGAGDEARTRDVLLGKEVLYH